VQNASCAAAGKFWKSQLLAQLHRKFNICAARTINWKILEALGKFGRNGKFWKLERIGNE